MRRQNKIKIISFAVLLSFLALDIQSVAQATELDNEIVEEDTNIINSNDVADEEPVKTDEPAAEEIPDNTDMEQADDAELDTDDSLLETADSVFGDNSNEDDGLFIDGKIYKGNVWVRTRAVSDGASALTSGTKFIVTFESTEKDFKKDVTLSTSNSFDATLELPVDEYYISTQAYRDGQESNATLTYENEDDLNTVVIYQNEQELVFKLTGDVTSEETTVSDPDVPLENPKKDNFWLNLLKNNIIFLVLLLGCGVTLLVYRLRQDNQ